MSRVGFRVLLSFSLALFAVGCGHSHEVAARSSADPGPSGSAATAADIDSFFLSIQEAQEIIQNGVGDDPAPETINDPEAKSAYKSAGLSAYRSIRFRGASNSFVKQTIGIYRDHEAAQQVFDHVVSNISAYRDKKPDGVTFTIDADSAVINTAGDGEHRSSSTSVDRIVNNVVFEVLASPAGDSEDGTGRAAARIGEKIAQHS